MTARALDPRPPVMPRPSPRLARAAGNAFVARGAGGIINLSSVLALAPARFDGVYSGTKAYLLNLSHSLAAQVEGKGVRVQAVLPGATRTLLGFDRGEIVTIPPLADEGEWQAFEVARHAMDGKLSNRLVAPRYRAVVTA